jgi:hypothetical protein
VDLEAAWEIVRAATPAGWLVGRPMFFGPHRWAVWANGLAPIPRAGVIRLSQPKVALADDPDVAFDGLWRRYVRGSTAEPMARSVSPDMERAFLRDAFVRALHKLRNFDRSRVITTAPVQGRRVHHRLDVVVVDKGASSAFAHAIPLAANDDRAAYAPRGLVLDAAQDWPEGGIRLALHDDPPSSRRQLLEESTNVLTSAGVQLVRQSDIASVVELFDDRLFASIPA